MPLSSNKGIIAAILAPFFIACSVILIKLVGNSTQPLIIAGLGSLLAVPMLLLLHLFSSKSSLQFSKLLTELKIPFLKILFSKALLGQIFIIAGFTLTSAIKAVLLLRLEPVFVFGWSMLYHKESPKPIRLLLLFALLLGSALVVMPDGKQLNGPNLGDALIIISLVFFSYSYIPTKEIAIRTNLVGLNILSNLMGGLIITVLAIIFNEQHTFTISAKAFWLIAGYSFVFCVIGASLYFYAFKTLEPWIIASFLSLEVVYGLLLAFFILGETITSVQLLGAIIVLLATIGIGRFGHDV